MVDLFNATMDRLDKIQNITNKDSGNFLISEREKVKEDEEDDEEGEDWDEEEEEVELEGKE